MNRKNPNHGFTRIIHDQISGCTLTNVNLSSSLDPISRPRWLAEYEDEIVSWRIELMFESELSETIRTENHKTTILSFSKIDFLRFYNPDLPPMPTSPIFKSGLPEYQSVNWDSPEYGHSFLSGPTPSVWKSTSSELSYLAYSRRIRPLSSVSSQAHYIVHGDDLNLEVFGEMSVEQR